MTGTDPATLSRRRTSRSLRAAIAVLIVFALVLAGSAVFTWFEARRISAAFPPLGAFVDVADGRLHYTVREPAGPVRDTVVLLHGASGNQADLMVPLGEPLAAIGFRVVAFDRPGHGWSSRPAGRTDASPARQAIILREALERIGVHHAIIVGHSWAGALAANFALDHRDFTDGLVLISGVTRPWATGISWYYGPTSLGWIGPVLAHTLVMPLGLLLMQAGIDEVFSPQSPPPDFAAKTGVMLVLRPGDFVANAQDVDGLLAFVTAQAARMRSIAVPTALVAGDSDVVVPARAHALIDAREIPGARLTLLQGVGHSPHWSDPQAVVRAITDVADRIHGGGTKPGGAIDP